MAEEVPTALGRFQIDKLLGRGAMGVVYKAHDPHIERTVALKLIRADLLDGESRERYLARFRNEARVAGRCVHPNIIGLYDFALHEGNPYLVMEYVDGVDLGRAFPRGTPVAESAVVQIALQVLDALGYAHGFGIIHRDIKPANILLTPDGRLKITDFGISRFAFDSTQSAVMVGTPSYMSPEQCRGVQVDHRCDLFSFGCVLYELLSGHRAFGGTSYAETLNKLINEAHKPLQAWKPDISPALADIVDRALAKPPELRFADAAEMIAAIRRLDAAALPPAAGTAAVDEEAATLILTAGRQASPVTQPGTGTGNGSVLKSVDAASLATLERQLAHHIGPMAGYHLRRALREAQTTEEFCRLVGDLAPEGGPRESAIRDALLLVGGAEGPSTGAEPVAAEPVGAEPPAAEPPPDPDALTAEFLEAVTRALAEVMGPIAPRLVSKARAQASGRRDLVARCAETIPRPAERAQFRSLLPPLPAVPTE